MLRHILKTCAHTETQRRTHLQTTPLNDLLLLHPARTLRYLLAAGLHEGKETDLIRPTAA